VDIEGPQDTAF